MDNKKFSVLLSVYHKEKPEFFEQSLESIYNQTVKADEWVIVKDGPISAELQAVINKYKGLDGVVIKEVPLKENRGLGIALSTGIQQCSNELVARMDTDDIALPNRFELQLAEFEKNPDLDMCGGHIIEFEEDPSKPIAERKVPLTQEAIIKFQKKRTAFNHMTVMYKKSKVLEAGGYQHVPLMEDNMLWVNMLLRGAVCMNIDDYLCFARTNRNMIARRGGLSYFKKYRHARKLIYKTGFISYGQYFKTNFIQFFVCIMPGWLRKFVFFHFIHNKKSVKNDGAES